MVNWQGTKPGTFVNNSTIEPVSAENLNVVVNTIDKIATGGKDSGLNADTIRDVDFDALATTSDETLTNFYSFDSLLGSASEQLIDDGGLNMHGTAYNVTPVKGIISMAGSFNGTSSYASCPYTNKAAVVLALWYKGTETGEKSLIILKRANNAIKICLCLNSGYAQTKFLNTDSVLQTLTDTTTLVNDNVFHHIAVTHTGTNCHLFVDGVLKQSISQTLTTLYYNQLVIGASEEVTPTIFTSGVFDDVRVYNAPLTQNQIYGLYFNKINTKVGFNLATGAGGLLLLALSSLSSLTPTMDGTAAVGSSNVPSRQDHVHPSDTTRLAASAYTAADVLAKLLTVDTDTAGINATTLKSVTPGAGGLALVGLSALSTASPAMDGTAAAGLSSIPSRQDHVHPTDTSRAATSHTHDDRYFTEDEITTQMSDKASSTHNHDTVYANLSNYNSFHDWTSSKTYALNEPTFYQGVPYKSLVASNLNKTPSSNPASWQNLSSDATNIWASVITQVGVSGSLPVGFSTVESDAYGLWNATNKRFTISVAGRWRVSGAVKVRLTNTIYIYKNGVKWRTGSSGSQGFFCVADIMSTFAVGDYVDIRTDVETENEDYGHFQIEYIGS